MNEVTVEVSYRRLSLKKSIPQEAILEAARKAGLELKSSGIFRQAKQTFWEAVLRVPNYEGVALALQNIAPQMVREPVNVSVEVGPKKITINFEMLNLEKLDLLTPTYVKRDPDSGAYTTYDTPEYTVEGHHGWWVFFEYGAAAYNWGSTRFGYVPGDEGAGGWMIEFMPPHPGVLRISMFKKAWAQTKQTIYRLILDKYTEAFKKHLPAAIKRHMERR